MQNSRRESCPLVMTTPVSSRGDQEEELEQRFRWLKAPVGHGGVPAAPAPLLVVYSPAEAAAAARIASIVACGCDTIETCEPADVADRGARALGHAALRVAAG